MFGLDVDKWGCKVFCGGIKWMQVGESGEDTGQPLIYCMRGSPAYFS